MGIAPKEKAESTHREKLVGYQGEPGRELSSVGLSECKAGSSNSQGVQSNGSSTETNPRVCHLSVLLYIH